MSPPLARIGPMAAPFVKWAGGKGRLAPLIAASLEGQTPRRYFEPFTGGGAVFFSLQAQGLAPEPRLNDINPGLVEAYEVVRDDVDALIAELRVISALYLDLSATERAAMYYRIRREERDTPAGRAARLLFLNRTCFNGLFRVNRRGQFNVPHGAYARPRILDTQRLRQASSALAAVTITADDFETVCADAGEGDFVYLDPPYQPLSATSSFTAYTDRSFGPADQERLALCVRAMSQRGARIMLSNSAHPFIEGLYHGFYSRRVKMSRAINSVGKGRTPIDELLVTNWQTGPLSEAAQHPGALAMS